MNLNSSSVTYSPSLPSHSSKTLSSESQTFEKHVQSLANETLKELRSRSGLISVKFAEALLQKTFKQAYTQAMIDLKVHTPGLNQKILTAENDLKLMKAARKEAEISFRLAKARLDGFDQRIKTLEDNLESLIQGQLNLEHAIDQRDQDGQTEER